MLLTTGMVVSVAGSECSFSKLKLISTYLRLTMTEKRLTEKNVRTYFFSHHVIDCWNAMDVKTVSSSSIYAFKNRLNKIRTTRMATLWISFDSP